MLRTRLAVSMAVLVLVISSLLAGGMVFIGFAERSARSLITDDLEPSTILGGISNGYAVAIVDNVHKVRAGTVSFEDGRAVLAQSLATIEADWAKFAPTVRHPEERVLVDEASERMKVAAPALVELDEILRAEDQAALVQFAEHRLYPVIDPISETVGMLIGDQISDAYGTSNSITGAAGVIGMAMIAMLVASLGAVGYAAYVTFFSVSRRLHRIAQSLSQIAGGEFNRQVPFADRKDEIGSIAKAAEIFRGNGVKVAEMSRSELQRVQDAQADRQKMMASLRSAFGDVVDAAIAGDFSKRVAANFSDSELNELASSVNRLVDTVEAGLSGTGAVLASMAEEDLSQRMVGQWSGAFAKLQGHTNRVADKFSEVLGQLRSMSAELRNATTEILAGSGDLAERTSRQASTIEETSAAMEQVSAMVGRNAADARSAQRAASEMAKAAEGGQAIMVRTTSAMERISQSSAKIFSIIGLIDDIAFQTNLLALNASVEAARAGEAGKGFAVVAVEVRRLAQSAAGASSEVKELVELSTAEVQTGSRLVSEAATTLADLADTVRTNVALMGSIVEASEAQASTITEVAGAVRRLDEMTQNNAALVEETNAATAQTESQAVRLERIVASFTIRSEAPQQAPRLAA